MNPWLTRKKSRSGIIRTVKRCKGRKGSQTSFQAKRRSDRQVGPSQQKRNVFDRDWVGPTLCQRTPTGVTRGEALTSTATESPARVWIARIFSGVEDLVYIGLGLLLAGSAIVLLASTFMSFGQNLMSGQITSNIIRLLDQILLILLVVELLYTVQVSFREHAVMPEPFLLVGLIAAIRRVLILTAEFGQPGSKSDTVVQHFFMELGVLTFLIMALAVSLFVLRRRDTVSVAARA
jgi:uncharacterized membrane protein (DUF373 family)